MYEFVGPGGGVVKDGSVAYGSAGGDRISDDRVGCSVGAGAGGSSGVVGVVAHGSNGGIGLGDWVVLSAVQFPDHVPRAGIDWVSRLTYPNHWAVVESFHSTLADLAITNCNLAFKCLVKDLPVKKVDEMWDGSSNGCDHPIINQFKEFVRKHSPGQCKMYSIGCTCDCGLCSLDEIQLVLSECLEIINDCILRGMPVDDKVARVSNFIRGISK